MAITKIGSRAIIDGSILAADFAPGTVTSAKLTDSTIANSKLSNSGITIAGESVSLGGTVNLDNLTDWQSKITSDGSTVTTMVSGRGYFVDNSSAAGLVKLPASASRGDFVQIKDYAGNFGTNNLTIQRNGHNIQGVANDSLISTNRANLVLVYVDSTKGWLYTDEHNVGDLQNLAYVTATGGTVTTSGDYKIHKFTGDGTFCVSCGGNDAGSNTVDYLVVAGGGGGGQGLGAGAGGFRESVPNPAAWTASPLANPGNALPVSVQGYPITVGGGGAGTPRYGPGTSGSNSVFSTITSAGGGRGAFSSGPVSCRTGGSGGSAGGSYGPPAGGAIRASGNTPPVSPPQGSNGGSVPTAGSTSRMSAGGGATAQGGDGSPSSSASGGAGATTSISGSSTAYAGGGGAGGGNPQSLPGGHGSGGSGGGGAGGSTNPCGNGTPGTTNTGGGGGGRFRSNDTGTGGAGGSGIVIIRYKYQN